MGALDAVLVDTPIRSVPVERDTGTDPRGSEAESASSVHSDKSAA